MAKTEDSIQSEVIRRVKELHPYIRIFAIRNETNRYKSEECDIGHPDLQLEAICDNTTMILKLELKTKARRGHKNGGLSDKQLAWNDAFDDKWSYNCIRRIAYGTEDALRKIAIWTATIKPN